MSLPKLDFKILSSSSSELSEGSLDEIKKPLSKSRGWYSSKYCTYPQSIYLAFGTPINLRQINLLSHEKKISEKISFYAYCPQGDIQVKDYKTIPYLNFGYIKLNDNSDNNFKAREFKKVFVDVKCLYLRIDFSKNYSNAHNPFNQVSLINIEFFGYKLPGYRNSLINIEITDNNQEKLEDLSPTKNVNRNKNSKSFNIFLEELCGDKIQELNGKLAESTRNQNSNECFRIKECINEINNIGKKLYDLQMKKNEAVNEENFAKAQELKQSIDILQNQLNRIDIDQKRNRSKRKNSSAKKNNSNNNSTNNSFTENEENILEEIKEETENDINNNSHHHKKKEKINVNKNSNINSNNTSLLNNINDLNNYNITNYSNISNNTKSLDFSQGKIITNMENGGRNSLEFQEDEFDNQFDERIVPAVKNKQFDKTIEEIEQINEDIYKKKLGPLEEINNEDLANYELLIDYIEEEGLRKILSNQYDYKKQGFDLLSEKLKDIFESSNLKIIFCLFKLIAELIEDKKTSLNFDLLSLIMKIFENISENINKIEITREVSNFINDRILSKIILKLNDSSEMIRKKSYDIIVFLLYSNIIPFELLLNSLFSKDIKNKNNKNYKSSTYSIILKLDLMKDILKNYSKIINEGISTEETFPKNLLTDYLIIHITSSKNEIKNKCRPVVELAVDVLGLKIFKQKLMDFSQKDIEKLKIKNFKEITDFLKEVNTNLNLSSDYTMRESILRVNSNKPNDDTRKNGKVSPRNRSRSKSKENIQKNENYNKCSICQKPLGNENIIEHMKKCVMCHQCKKCKVVVEVKNLTEHRLNECSKKDKFKLCQRCQEAIPLESYQEHEKNKKCNQYKKNCNRCPLCHGDIPLSKDGFFKHLSVDGCPYKIKYKKLEKK